MLSFNIPIIDGFDCLMDILGQLYDWSNLKKKQGLNVCHLMIKLNDNYRELTGMASWCLQNVIKQKQKTSFHNLCSLEIAHNKLTMSTVVGRHTGLNTKLHFNSIRVHYSGQKRKLTFYLKGMLFNGCPMIFNFLPSAQRFLKKMNIETIRLMQINITDICIS